MEKIFESLPEILKIVATNPISLIALIFVLLAVLASILFKDSKDLQRLSAFIALLAFAVFVVVTVRTPPEISCIRPEELAKQKAWRTIGPPAQPDSGLQVTISTPGSLPLYWAAIEHKGKKKQINGSDEDRSMNAGNWTIYTPVDCRRTFGFTS